MQDHKVMTLSWRSYSGGTSDIIGTIYANIGGESCNYVWMLLNSQVIMQDVRPKISDAPYTLISRMGQ